MIGQLVRRKPGVYDSHRVQHAKGGDHGTPATKDYAPGPETAFRKVIRLGMQLLGD